MDITNIIGRKIYGNTIISLSTLAKDKSQLAYTIDGMKVLVYLSNLHESPYYNSCDMVVKQSDFLFNIFYGFNR